MTDTSALWDSVDLLTKPTRRKVLRDDLDDDPAADLLDNLAHNPTRRVCHIGEYRRAQRMASEQTAGWATVPSLWDQAEKAVSGQGDVDGGGAVPKRERSVADLALMETLHDVRAILFAEIAERHLAARATTPGMVRQVASTIAADNDSETLAWWTWRVEHWVRLIGNQLNAAEHAPKPIRLRDSACPACGVRQIRVTEQGEPRMVPPIRIDFRQGQIRAAECGGCGKSWFRGDSLVDLADALATQMIATAS